jgi:chromosome segregation ATPase
MSEYLFKTTSNQNPNPKSFNNSIIKEIESWQDDVLFSKLEEHFSKTSKIEDLNKIESEKKIMIEVIETIQMKIDTLKSSQVEKQEKIENLKFNLEEARTIKMGLVNKMNDLQTEIKEKHEKKNNLENPLAVSEVFIEKLDVNGLNYLFMQLYNKVQQQQYYLHAQSYNILLNNYGYMNNISNVSNLNMNSSSEVGGYNDGGNIK